MADRDRPLSRIRAVTNMKISKMPKPVVKFEVPIYGGILYLYADKLKYTKASEALGDPGIDISRFFGAEQYFEFDNGARVYTIGWFDGTMSTLFHEITHAALDIFDGAGIDPICGNGEPFAYLMSSIYDLIGVES